MPRSHRRVFSPASRTVAALVVVALLSACANPVPPSGGPRDSTPPRIERTTPPTDTVNVPTSTRTVRIAFSEYVERSSLQQALTVTPAFERPLEFDWDGRAVEVVFPETLRDSTTYILSLTTDLSDTRGVSLEQPITIAFSTGPRINKGRITGTVAEPREGEPQSKVDVYAYAAPDGAPPDSLPEAPAYRTQTGEDGSFTFNYMREQRYYVVALKDNNRNRRPDRGEPFAPPPRPAFAVDSSGVQVPVPWLLAAADTTGPAVQSARSLTRRRVSVRFDEAVRLPTRSGERWLLQDSTSAENVPVTNVYRAPGSPAEVVLRTGRMRAVPHRLVVADSAVADSVGQPLSRPDTARFLAASGPDTLQTRFEGFGPPDLQEDSLAAYRLLPGTAPTVSFNQAPGRSLLRQAVAGQDTTGAARSVSTASDDGTTFRVRFDTLAPGQIAEVTVDGSVLAGGDTTYVQRYRRLTADVLGELEGRVLLADTATAEMEGPPPGADTTRTGPARPDTTQPDTTQPDTTQPDTTQPDTSRTGAPRPDSLQTDSLKADSLKADAPGTDSLKADSLQADSLRADTVKADPLAADSIMADSVQADSVQADSVQADSVQTDTLRALVTEGPIVVELIAEEATPPVAPRTLTTPPDSAFVFGELPEGRYRFRAFVDRNANGRWDPGRLTPYRPPEPITWSDQPTSSRKRWTTVLPAPLRIVVLR